MRNNQALYLVIVFVLMVTTLLTGFFIIKSEQSSNCWDQYSTEEQAILNCEVHQ